MGGLGGRSVSSGVHAVPSSHHAPTAQPLGSSGHTRRLAQRLRGEGAKSRSLRPSPAGPAPPPWSPGLPADPSTFHLGPLASGPLLQPVSPPPNSAGPPVRSLPSASWRGSKGVTSQVTFPHPPALSFCPGLPCTDLSCTRRHSGGQGPSLRGPEAPGVPRKGWEERLTAGSVALPRV